MTIMTNICLWSKVILCYIGTFVTKWFEMHKNLFKDTEVHYAFIYLIVFPVYNHDLNKMRLGLVQTL